jgi:hypothetical protein
MATRTVSSAHRLRACAVLAPARTPACAASRDTLESSARAPAPSAIASGRPRSSGCARSAAANGRSATRAHAMRILHSAAADSRTATGAARRTAAPARDHGLDVEALEQARRTRETRAHGMEREREVGVRAGDPAQRDDDQRAAARGRSAREALPDRCRLRRPGGVAARGVEHHRGEAARLQQALARAHGLGDAGRSRPQHALELHARRARRRGMERVGRVDHRHHLAAPGRAREQCERERGAARRVRTHELADPAAREPTPEQRVERGDARGEIGARLARVAAAAHLGAEVAQQPGQPGAHSRLLGGGRERHGKTIFGLFSPFGNRKCPNPANPGR